MMVVDWCELLGKRVLVNIKYPNKSVLVIGEMEVHEVSPSGRYVGLIWYEDGVMKIWSKVEDVILLEVLVGEGEPVTLNEVVKKKEKVAGDE